MVFRCRIFHIWEMFRSLRLITIVWYAASAFEQQLGFYLIEKRSEYLLRVDFEFTIQLLYFFYKSLILEQNEQHDHHQG
jgi:hypothetical protein